MLDFGFSEILLTSAIALVVLGPEKLPKVARQVGNWMGRARLMARQLSEQLEREVNAEELLKQKTAIDPPAALPALAPRSPSAPSAESAFSPAASDAGSAVPPPSAKAYREPHPNSPAAMHPVTPPAPANVEQKQTAQ
jgi:sec-independent protein translocase protein TatB